MWRIEGPVVNENAVFLISLEFRSDIGGWKYTAFGKTTWVFGLMGVNLFDVLFQFGHGFSCGRGINRL